MKKAPRTITLDQMFPSIPRWELMRSVNKHFVRYRVPLAYQIAVHEAKAKHRAAQKCKP